MIMDARTRTALQGAIAKWQAIVDGTGVDKAFMNCPLCEIFAAPRCPDCPVQQATGQPGCVGTPYRSFADAATYEWGTWRVGNAASQHAAESMLEFLERLLPEEPQPKPQRRRAKKRIVKKAAR